MTAPLALVAVAQALGLPTEPIVRRYDREPLPYGQRYPATISSKERDRRKAKKREAKRSQRRNRR